MKTSGRILLAAAIFLTALTCARGARFERRQYSCYMLSGNADELGYSPETADAWEVIPRAAGFLKTGEFMMASRQTSFMSAHTDSALYFRVECVHSGSGPVVTEFGEGDINLWQDEGIELFLVPEGSDIYHHFIINAVGAGWHGAWQSPAIQAWEQEPPFDWKTRPGREKGMYSIDIEIPFDVFGEKPESGARWLFNIARNDLSGTERTSSWSYLPAGFHAPSKFGELVFRDEHPDCAVREKEERKGMSYFGRALARRMRMLETWKGDFRRAMRGRYAGHEARAALDASEWIEDRAGSFEDMSVREADVMIRKSSVILAEMDALRARLLMEELF